MIILVGAVCFFVSGVMMYYLMRGEIDDAWGQARRMLAEKEHYRLAYEELRQKRGK